MEAKVGLILGDSILHDYFEYDTDLTGAMRKNFDLDSLYPIFDKGKSIEFLVRNTFPQQMAEILSQNHGDAMVDVFLAAGAVDLSRCVCINQLIWIFYLDISIQIFHIVNFVNSGCVCIHHIIWIFYLDINIRIFYIGNL